MNTFIDNVTLESAIDTQLNMIDCLIKECVLIQYYQNIFLEDVEDAVPQTSSPVATTGDTTGDDEPKSEPTTPTEDSQQQQVAPPNPTIDHAKNIANNPQAKQSWFQKVRTAIGKFFTSISELISPDNVKAKEQELQTNVNAVEETMQQIDQLPEQPVEQPDPAQPNVKTKTPQEVKEALMNWVQNVDFDRIQDFQWKDQTDRVKAMLQEMITNRTIMTVFTPEYQRAVTEIKNACDQGMSEVSTNMNNTMYRANNATNDADRSGFIQRGDQRTGWMLSKLDTSINHYGDILLGTMDMNKKGQRSYGTRTVGHYGWDEYTRNVASISDVIANTKTSIDNLQKQIDDLLAGMQNQTAPNNVSNNPDDDPIALSKHCLETSKNVVNILMRFNIIRDADNWAFKMFRNIANYQLNQPSADISNGESIPDMNTNQSLISTLNQKNDNTGMNGSSFMNNDFNSIGNGGSLSNSSQRDVNISRIQSQNDVNGGDTFGNYNNKTR